MRKGTTIVIVLLLVALVVATAVQLAQAAGS